MRSINLGSVAGMMPLASEGFMDPQSIVGGFGIQLGMKIADFGSGAGFFSILMAKLTGPTGSVTAIDVLDSALETVRSNAHAQGLQNVHTVRSNLEVPGSSGLSDNSQDLVLIKNILFQSEKKEEILKEALRITQPGGTVIIIDWKKGAPGLGPPDHLRSTPAVLENIAKHVGLKLTNTVEPDAFHFEMRFQK